MTKIYFFLSILFLYSCSDKRIKSDLISSRINGNVKSIIEKTFSTAEIDGKRQKNILELTTIKNYDPKGNILTEKNYIKIQQKDTLYSKAVYNYDDSGNQIEINFYGLDKKKIGKRELKFDSQGNKIEEKNFESDSKIGGKSIFSYDEQGNLIQSKNSKIKLESIINYKYDSKNNMTEEERYNSGDTLYMRIKYSYDDKNNQLSISTYNPDSLILTKSYKYEKFDKNGNWLIRNEYYDNKLEIIIEREIEYY